MKENRQIPPAFKKFFWDADFAKLKFPEHGNYVLGKLKAYGDLASIKGDNMWNYVERAGGVTDSANYALVQFPNGNVEKHGLGIFSGDPSVNDGSTIIVTKVPPPPPATEGLDLGTTIKDLFAILTSAVTIIYLASHFTK